MQQLDSVDKLKDNPDYEEAYTKQCLRSLHRDYTVGTKMESIDDSLIPVARELDDGSSGSSLFSYKWQGKEKKMAYRTLLNNMRLAITVPVTEIDTSKNSLILQISIVAVIISVISVLLMVLLTRRIIKPLKELNVYTKKLQTEI